MEHVPFTIIGGGICGVLTALKVRSQFPDQDVVLLDKEPFAGHHNTTRNSGVLHAGIYYDTGSLKHLLCLNGHRQWLQLAHKYSIPLFLCGKFIIATKTDELEHLSTYYQKGIKNGVSGLRKMTPIDMQEIEAFTTVADGFFSAQTGILDISTGINRLFAELSIQGVMSFLNTEVLEITQTQASLFHIQTNNAEFTTTHLINCAGSGAVDLRKKLGLRDIENKFVKGNYLKLNKPFYNEKLIYPVPLKNLKGLGVHTSFHIDRIVRFGPNTEDVVNVDYKNEEQNIDLMYPAIHEKFKGIKKQDLSLDYVGIRTKIEKHGIPYSDFLIQGPNETNLLGYYEALGIESPGMTAAPAIADLILEKIQGFLKKTL